VTAVLLCEDVFERIDGYLSFGLPAADRELARAAGVVPERLGSSRRLLGRDGSSTGGIDATYSGG